MNSALRRLAREQRSIRRQAQHEASTVSRGCGFVPASTASRRPTGTLHGVANAARSRSVLPNCLSHDPAPVNVAYLDASKGGQTSQ